MTIRYVTDQLSDVVCSSSSCYWNNSTNFYVNTVYEIHRKLQVAIKRQAQNITNVHGFAENTRKVFCGIINSEPILKFEQLAHL